MLEMFWTFFKIGLFTFGGGYAMLPLLKAEIVDKHSWASEEELMNYFSIGQCTPGIIAINVSTFIGYKMFGKIGAVVATAGMVTPSLIIIILAASVLQAYMHNEYLEQAFAGIRIGVTALIADTVWGMRKKAITDGYGVGAFLIAVTLLMWLNISAVIVVCAAAVGGWLFKYLKGRVGRR